MISSEEDLNSWKNSHENAMLTVQGEKQHEGFPPRVKVWEWDSRREENENFVFESCRSTCSSRNGEIGG